MAYATGTATDYLDLFERFRTFITSNAALVAAGQQWTQMRYSTSEAGTGRRVLMLRGPGNAGTDQIYVNLQTDFNTPNDWYNWKIWGATGYNAATAYNDQPGQTSAAGRTGYWARFWYSTTPGASAIPYWFIADGRCFKIIAKVSNTYQQLFGGFFLPYATPNEYPYPLMIGAMGYQAEYRWSQSDYRNWAYWKGYYASAHRWIDGAWHEHATVNSSYTGYSTGNSDLATLVWPKNSRHIDGQGFDGSYRLAPLSLYHFNGANADIGARFYGMLPGIFHVSGYQNGSENIITIDAKNYLVVQNGYQTGIGDYVAYLLE